MSILNKIGHGFVQVGKGVEVGINVVAPFAQFIPVPGVAQGFALAQSIAGAIHANANSNASPEQKLESATMVGLGALDMAKVIAGNNGQTLAIDENAAKVLTQRQYELIKKEKALAEEQIQFVKDCEAFIKTIKVTPKV